MAYLFPSDEWIKAFEGVINESESYRKSAIKWEGDFYFICESGPGVPDAVVLYIDLWHGEARSAGQVADEGAKSPEFTIRAPLSIWRKVIGKKLDPIQGMITGQLKLKGTMGKIMRFPKAATELVNCATKVPTEFPD